MDKRYCLMLHGFTGGPYELAPLAEHLTQSGVICHVPVLPGHDPELHTLGQVQWHDWLDAATEEAASLTRQHGEIDLVGFSMGGLLTAYLANRFPIRKLVLLNAAVFYFSPLRFLKEAARRCRHDDWAVWNRKMKRTPLQAALQFMALNKQLRPELSRITVPTFIAQGEEDPIIHPKSAMYVFRQLQGEKEIHYYSGTRHMICLEPKAPSLFESIERFMLKA